MFLMVPLLVSASSRPLDHSHVIADAEKKVDSGLFVRIYGFRSIEFLGRELGTHPKGSWYNIAESSR